MIGYFHVDLALGSRPSRASFTRGSASKAGPHQILVKLLIVLWIPPEAGVPNGADEDPSIVMLFKELEIIALLRVGSRFARRST